MHRAIRIFIVAATVALVAVAVASQWWAAYAKAWRFGANVTPQGFRAFWFRGDFEWRAGVKLWDYDLDPPNRLAMPDVDTYPDFSVVSFPWWFVLAAWLLAAAVLWRVKRKPKQKAGAFPVEATGGK